MEGYKTRIIIEAEELGSKIEKLKEFKKTDSFKKLTWLQRLYLNRQLFFMKKYLMVLEERAYRENITNTDIQLVKKEREVVIAEAYIAKTRYKKTVNELSIANAKIMDLNEAARSREAHIHAQDCQISKLNAELKSLTTVVPQVKKSRKTKKE